MSEYLEPASVLVLCVATLAAWWWLNRSSRGRRRSDGLLGEASCGGAGAGGLTGRGAHLVRMLIDGRGWARIPWLVPELLLVAVGLGAALPTRSPVPLVAMALAVHPAYRWRIGRRVRRAARGRADAVVELCAALAGELRGGATPEQALAAVTSGERDSGGLLARLGPEAVSRLSASRYGADVPAALHWLAGQPGGGGAAAVAACWQITTESGGGLAAGLDRVAEALRADRALAQAIEGELAGPRTTAVLLAALPGCGLLLGGLLGARPWEVLLHTSLGLGCLGVGALLEAAGLAWTDRIVRGAQLAGAGELGGPLAVAVRGDRLGARAGRRPNCVSGQPRCADVWAVRRSRPVGSRTPAVG
ncbi:type II secretion system F family protein [Kitasatospora sp. NPDC052896]|uniref:type II secretion system F family protein n=1 Tax=Kitasatospora sp. NPDC052896 TaxID=3364061 RepID=UPI0037C7BD60